MSIGSLSRRPTLITTSIVFWRIWNLFHKENAAPWAGHKPTTSVTLVSAHCPTNLGYGEKLAGVILECNWITGLVLLFVLVSVGWPKPIWHELLTIIGRHICYNVMTLQLGNCPILAVWLRPATNYKQLTNQTHTACWKVMGSSPGAANFIIWMFNLGIAHGAKVGLKLRLFDRVIAKCLCYTHVPYSHSCHYCASIFGII